MKIKVARIADSPLAPIFEVVERPNNWERAIHSKTTRNPDETLRTEQRHEFWKAYVDSVPEAEKRFGPARRTANHWCLLEDLDLILSLYIGKDTVGIFIRGAPRADGDQVRLRLEPHTQYLTDKLGCEIGTSQDHFFAQWIHGDYTDVSQYPVLIRWLSEKAVEYENALSEVVR